MGMTHVLATVEYNVFIKLQVVVDYNKDIYAVYACYYDNKRRKRKIHESYSFVEALQHVADIVRGKVNFYV